MTLPRRLLIANRGEIACRIARTATRLGIDTVAVYSDADVDAPHVRACRRALRIGPAQPAESYLRIEAVLAAARASEADAIHPGYGFLSENAAFAQACVDAGVTFVGPPPAAIRAMGSKAGAKDLMGRAGVPLTPGYHGEAQDAETLLDEARRIGFPVLIKASAGGGGKGMRRVDRADDFAAALAACQREAAAAFGDARVLLERYVLRPRHIELQVFADGRGNVVHLFERDCSVQRRHQKVLEEAPAPGMTSERRAAMAHAAIEAARAVGYVGAGTVEFIVAPDGQFYFMEMNTRLQVEHPVTEMITGLDLVEWQLRVAGGEPLPEFQPGIRAVGHAIEARLYAEDPARGFLPSTGKLEYLEFPGAAPGIRIDSGVAEGGAVTPYYDALLAKLVVHGATRDEARQRLERALGECRIAGVTSNLQFLRRLVDSASFRHADLDTGLIEREQEALFAAAPRVPAETWLGAAAALLAHEAAIGDGSPWSDRSGWRLTGPARRRLVLATPDESATIAVTYGGGDWTLMLGSESVRARGQWLDSRRVAVWLDDRRRELVVQASGSTWQVFDGPDHWPIERVDPFQPRQGGDLAAGSHLRAPMPGRVVGLLAQPGTHVERGAPLLVLEAMKMEHTVAAPVAGTLEAFLVEVGQQLAEGSDLAVLSPDAPGRSIPLSCPVTDVP